MPSAFAIYMHRLFRSGMTPVLRIALAVGFVLHGTVFFLITPSLTFSKNNGLPAPGVVFAGAAEESREAVELSDSEPLYFPTAMNFGSGAGAGLSDEADSTFRASPFKPFASNLRLSDGSDLRKEIPLETPVVTPSPADALGLRYWRTTATFGKTLQPEIAMPAREALLRIERLADGKKVFEEPVSPGFSPELAGTFWAPAVFFCTLDTFGLYGAPTRVAAEGTGNAEVDAKIYAMLEKFPFSKRLPPGQYRIVVSP